MGSGRSMISQRGRQTGGGCNLIVGIGFWGTGNGEGLWTKLE